MFIKQVSANNYTTNSKYSILSKNSKFYVVCNNVIRQEFCRISAAHNYIAKQVKIDNDLNHEYSFDDFEFVVEAYGFEYASNNTWKRKVGNSVITLKPEKRLILNIFTNLDSDYFEFDSADELVDYFETRFGDISIFESISFTNISDRYYVIQAASNSRDIIQKLVRVKSSNIWAYGINIKDRKDKVGDVVVQFKGKNGGPDDIYMYFDVPIKLWRQWLSANSKGSFFWRNIRNEFYYRKLTGNKRGVLKNALN